MLQHTIKAVIRPGEESGYVAECLEVPVVTRGARWTRLRATCRRLSPFTSTARILAALWTRREPDRGRHDGAAADACLGSAAWPARRSFASWVNSRFVVHSIATVAISSCDAFYRTVTRQILTVPAHSELDTGTMSRHSFRQAARFVADEDLRPLFYIE